MIRVSSSQREVALLLIAGLALLGQCQAAEPQPPGQQTPAKTDSPGEIAFFESRIRPALIEHCYDCHSAESGMAEGELRVDSRQALRMGGTRGPAVVPGKPESSLLLTAIEHADADLKMPPKSPRLSPDLLRDFRKWIELGAADPRDERSGSPPATGSRRPADFWTNTPPQAAPAPVVSDDGWPRDPFDRFVLHRLEEYRLTPSRDAAPHVLLRRLHFDLVGLPPSPAEIDRFRRACESSGIDAALAAEVDRLLDSPRFGERWGRHWLDVARFGESSGKEANIPFPYAWRYRDYVIDAVNADLPVNRFLTEQLAGDLLPADSDRERARLLVATGFLAVGTKNLAEMNDAQFQADIIDEQIDSVTRAMLGSSIACARCHDHKFDPYTMRDYYALGGIFGSTHTYFGTYVSPASQQGGDLMRLPRLEDEVVLHDSVPPKRVQELRKQLAELRAERDEMDEALRAVLSGQKPKREFTLRDALANIWRTGPIEGQLQLIDDEGRAVPVAMGVRDRDTIQDAPLLTRGEVARPGEPVPRGFPDAIPVADAPAIPSDASGRLELARWITDPDHPLTSRVFVNRVWRHLFGAGLVSTVDDFGATGAPPSHPELLDTLAVEFMSDGWSLKRLVRRLVLTRTYRQSSDYDAQKFLADPENRWLWRMPKRRLEAEAIRDAMLAASGELDTERPKGSLVARVIKDRPISLIGLDPKIPADLDASRHRSVYLPIVRDRLPEVLEIFDFAEPSLVTGKRETTNVPVQALYLLNSPFVQERASALAARLRHESAMPIGTPPGTPPGTAQASEAIPDYESATVLLAFRLCFGREPDRKELAWAKAFLQSERERSSGPEASSTAAAEEEAGDAALIRLCHALFCTAEFRNLD